MTKRQHSVLRIRIITGVVITIALLLIIRLYYLQVVRSEYYTVRAEDQYVQTKPDLYNRGSIFFTTKTGELVSAASIKTGYTLSVNPTQISDPAAVYEALVKHLPLDREQFIERATTPNRVNVEVAKEVPTEIAEAVTAEKITGVHLNRDQWRYYPGGDLAARLIGFVGYSGDPADGLAGRYGVERYYEDVLVRATKHQSVDFFAEIFSSLGTILFDSTPARTGDVVLTVEPTVSRMLDQTLAEAQAEWNSKLTGGIIMNPKTGAIYAMNVAPTFDLNNRSTTSIDSFRDPLVEGVYEFGSIIKALTMAAGIDSGAVSPATTYYDPGRLKIDDYTISNYDGRGRGTVDMQEVLNQSLNTGVAFVVKTMGKTKFREYFKALKLGSETGIDLPNETYGLITNLDSPRDIEYATASYGQGIAMTPVETARALATLGNGGVLVTPHVADRIIYQDGSEKVVTFPPGERVFSENTSLTISRMLTTVVDEALSGGKRSMPHHSIAAKTGTAQIADPAGGYYKDRYLHSFFGYFPSYDPQFLVFLYTVEPKGVQYASQTLTTPFMDIATFLINYYNVPPDR